MADENADRDPSRTPRRGHSDETNREREARAQDLAVKTALREAHVDGRLREDQQRLDRINGAIDRFNKALDIQEQRMVAIERAFGEFAAISRAVAEKGVSTRTFVLGVLAVLIPVVVLFLSSGKHP